MVRVERVELMKHIDHTLEFFNLGELEEIEGMVEVAKVKLAERRDKLRLEIARNAEKLQNLNRSVDITV